LVFETVQNDVCHTNFAAEDRNFNDHLAHTAKGIDFGSLSYRPEGYSKVKEFMSKLVFYS